MTRQKLDFDNRNQICKIKIKRSTKLRLAALSRFFCSYDVVLNELLNHTDQCQRFWEDRP